MLLGAASERIQAAGSVPASGSFATELTAALAEADLDVRSARMSTLGAEVVDAFYVVDGNGRRVDDPVQRGQIERMTR